MPKCRPFWIAFGIFCALSSSCAVAAPSREPLHEACIAGDLDACESRGQSLLSRDRRAALTSFRVACLEGRNRSCTETALTQAGTTDGASASPYTLELLTRACRGGDDNACCLLAERLGGAEATGLYEAACERGHHRSCTRWATHLRAVSAAPKVLEEALRLDDRACSAGVASGCLGAGHAHFFGVGVDRDVDKGLAYLERACTPDDREACGVLIKMYEEGLGVAADPARAESYRKIESQHVSHSVGPMTESPYLVYLDACNWGDPLGCFAAAYDAALGTSRPRNISLSRELFERACADGMASACKRWTLIDPWSRSQ